MELHIEIKGAAGTGKSTVAKIIADALNKNDIPCEVDDGLDGDYGQWQADKLVSLHKRKDFIIKVKTSS